MHVSFLKVLCHRNNSARVLFLENFYLSSLFSTASYISTLRIRNPTAFRANYIRMTDYDGFLYYLRSPK